MNTPGGPLAAVTTIGALSWFGNLDLMASEGGCEEAMTSAEMRACANERYEPDDAELNRV